MCRGVVLNCIFHPSQLLLISCGDDSQIKIWDLISKSCVATLQAHFSAVTSLAISEDGWTLLSGGRDGVVVLWNLKNYSKIATIPVYEAVESIVALPRELTTDIKFKSKSALAFATGGEKGLVKFWRSDTATSFSEDLPSMPAPSGAGSIVELCLSQSKSFAVAAATQDCRLLLLNLDGKNVDLHRQFIGNNDEVTDLRFVSSVADGKSRSRVAVATNSEHIHMLDSETLGCLDTLTGHKEAVLSLDYTQTRDQVGLLASGSKDTTVRVWDVTGNKASCLAVGTGHVSAVTAVAFCRRATSNFLVSGGADKLLRAWDISKASQSDGKGKPLPVLAAIPAHDKDINAVCVSPNDQVVASASQDRTIKVWRMPDLTPVTVLRGHKRGVWSIAFSPVDQALVSASGDKTIKLWNLKDGSCLRTFEGHIASVLRVNFLSAGTQILSSGADGLIKLWNIRTAECVSTFDAHDDKVWALALGDESGDVAASGGSDGSIAIWKDCTELDKLNAVKEAEDMAVQEQELENAVYDRKWEQAARLAINMGRPGQLLNVVKRAIEGSDDATANSILHDVARSLDANQIKKSLEYCREWNTHSKNCSSAQALLHAILAEHPQEELMAIQGVDGILDGIDVYTKRHRSRVDRLIRSSYVVDFILGVMGALTPVSDPSPTKSKMLTRAVANGDSENIGGAGEEDKPVTNKRKRKK